MARNANEAPDWFKELQKKQKKKKKKPTANVAEKVSDQEKNFAMMAYIEEKPIETTKTPVLHCTSDFQKEAHAALLSSTKMIIDCRASNHFIPD